MQLTHYNSKFEAQTFPITLVCDNVTKAPNIGSLFRISDAFGVEQLIFCGKNVSLGRRFTKTSRATEKHVNHTTKPDITNVIQELKAQQYYILALEITKNSTPIHQFNPHKNTPIAIIIGDENFGVSEDILTMTDATVHINMFGKNSSMNVAQATSIALYEITKQLIA